MYSETYSVKQDTLVYSETCRVEMPETKKLCWINTEKKDSSGERIQVIMVHYLIERDQHFSKDF